MNNRKCCIHNDEFSERLHARGGGCILVLFVVRGRAMFRGTYSQRYGFMGIIFAIFIHFTEILVSF